MRHAPSVAALLAAALLAAPARAQDKPAPPAGPQPAQQPVPIKLTPIPAPKGVGAGEKLPPIQRPQARPTAEEVTDDPTLAVEIDGKKIDRATYGEALIEEYGLSFLDQFVASTLVEGRAAALGVTISADALDPAVDKQVKETLERRFRGNQAAMDGALHNAGLTLDSWRARMRRSIGRDMLLAAVVKADRDTSEPALRKEYEARYGARGEHRSGRAILFSTQVWSSNLYSQADFEKDKPALLADAMARATTAVADLKAGADFATIARERGEDPMAAQGGDYKGMWKSHFGPDAEAQIAALDVGALSGPIETPRGVIVAQCYGVQEGWDFHARHILYSTRLDGMPDAAAKAKKLADARAKADSAIAALKGGADFAALAREQSDDPGSKANGGDLGTFGAGRMVAPFEDAVKKLAPGEVSGPVESQFGVHVIQLIDKTRKPADDVKLVRIMLFSTEYLKVKERKLHGLLEDKARAAAADAESRLKAGEDAAALAKGLTEEPQTKEKSGQVEDPFPPYFGKGAADAFDHLAAPGDVTTVKTERGYVVLKLESLDKHDFDSEKAAIAKEIREKEPTPVELRLYREKLRAAATVKRGRM